tara:strand:- start:745 stop:1266 length:522 start_codon:yes stop_codon:yes gene_type:complete
MAEETYFDKISAQIKTGDEPYTWYRNRIKELGTPTVPELLRSGKLNKTPHPKHLNMFVYAPKFAKKLPYYDTFPLVMYLKPAEGGFYGLNFHYLPYALRARLLDAAGQNKLSVSAVENSRLTKPTIKRYLFGYTRSMFRRVDSEDNLTAIMLPVQRFKKASDTKVWGDSRKMI